MHGSVSYNSTRYPEELKNIVIPPSSFILWRDSLINSLTQLNLLYEPTKTLSRQYRKAPFFPINTILDVLNFQINSNDRLPKNKAKKGKNGK